MEATNNDRENLNTPFHIENRKIGSAEINRLYGTLIKDFGIFQMYIINIITVRYINMT